MSNVQIPDSLFAAMWHYMFLGNGSEDASDAAESLRRALGDKMDAIARRELYKRSQTAKTAQERETARQGYLDRRGIREDFRW